MATALKTFIVSRNNPETGKFEEIEVKAERAETEGSGSTRVTFFTGEDPVASFINLSGWYLKPTA